MLTSLLILAEKTLLNISPSRSSAASKRAFFASSFAFRMEAQELFRTPARPLLALLTTYREKHNCTFFWSRKAKRNSHATKTGILRPYRFPLETRGVNCLDKVWAFDSESHYETVRGIVDSIRASATIGKDLINCLELCLNEITDNVLNHSANDEESATGFVMAQVHREKQRIAVAVFDRGIGILESLRRSGRAVSSSSDAISLAVKKGISDGKGAGKGLWILEQIIIDNEGSFEITSDGSRYSLRHLEKKRGPKLAQTTIATRIPGTTLIDFQLNTANPTSISTAISGYKHVDLWAEAHEENDDGRVPSRFLRTFRQPHRPALRRGCSSSRVTSG